MSKALIVTCAHFYKTRDGVYYTPSIHDYGFFKRYLNVFDEIRVVGRCYPDEVTGEGMLKVSGPGLEVFPLPWFHGIKSLMMKIPFILKKMLAAPKGCCRVIYRIPQMESYLAFFCRKKNMPFAVEVIADPIDWSMLSGVAKQLNIRLMSHMIRKADCVSYVRRALEKRYPCSSSAFVTDYSSIELPDSLLSQPKTYVQKDQISIIHVTNAIENETKGHKVLIDAVRKCRECGYNVTVSFIGTGSKVQEFQEYTKACGVDSCIHFIGRIAEKSEMIRILAEHDIMVFPSETEGLPRVIIEAEAAGLPCLASNVGGIPDLLPGECLFKPKDADSFAARIMELQKNPGELTRMSAQNVKTASQYVSSILTKRRNEFYSHLLALPEKSMKKTTK